MPIATILSSAPARPPSLYPVCGRPWNTMCVQERAKTHSGLGSTFQCTDPRSSCTCTCTPIGLDVKLDDMSATFWGLMWSTSCRPSPLSQQSPSRCQNVCVSNECIDLQLLHVVQDADVELTRQRKCTAQRSPRDLRTTPHRKIAPQLLPVVDKPSDIRVLSSESALPMNHIIAKKE